jgi:hypothetical protein
MVRGKFIAMSPNVKQIKRSQINNLIMLLKFLKNKNMPNLKITVGE